MVDIKAKPETVSAVRKIAAAIPLAVVWTYWGICLVGGLVSVFTDASYHYVDWTRDLGLASIALAIVYSAHKKNKPDQEVSSDHE